MVTLDEPPRQRVRVWDPSLGLGVAVGLAVEPTTFVQGPPHDGPDQTAHAGPAIGVISATWPAAKPTPATVNGVAEVTMTRFPSFSVMSTRMVVASAGPDRPDRFVPP